MVWIEMTDIELFMTRNEKPPNTNALEALWSASCSAESGCHAMSDTSLLPRLEARETGAAAVSAAPRKRILLVEGDGFTRLVLLLRLRLAGFGVDFTSNGILGLGKLRSSQPDILLVESRLCGLSGLDLIKAARAEKSFGNRPIYVFTHVDKMNRATRKEIAASATKVFDKKSTTREDLVQIFANTFLAPHKSAKPKAQGRPESRTEQLARVAPPGAIEEIVAGVREQAEALVQTKEPAARQASAVELHSRVCSLASCAEAAGLAPLAGQAKALQMLLEQLGKSEKGYSDAALESIRRSVRGMNHQPSPNKKAEPKRLLHKAVIVDEAPSSSKALQDALLEQEFESVCFEDPARARQYLAANPADLILINLLLPEAHCLALPHIRELPLHSETPVLFGPESTLTRPVGEELPTNAPRLDTEPRLLAELVLQALNAVQAAASLAQEPPPIPSPAADRPSKTVVAPATVAALALDDEFDLFARQTAQPQHSGAHLPLGAIASNDEPGEQPLTWGAVGVQPEAVARPAALEMSAATEEWAQPTEHAFGEKTHPTEPVPRAAGTTETDTAADWVEPLPENIIDGINVEDSPVPMTPLADFQVAPPPPEAPEQNGGAEAAAAAWPAAAAGDNGEFQSAGRTAFAPVQNAAAGFQGTIPATLNEGELMNTQLQAAPAEINEADATLGAAAAQRQDLATRVCEAEMALHLAHGQIERQDQVIADLQNRIAESTTAQPTAASAPPTEAEQKAQVRCAELEQELASLRQAFEGLSAGVNSAPPVPTMQPPVAPAGGSALPVAQNAVELEQQLRQSVAALARATAELAKERGERQRSDKRAAELNGRLQALHEDFRRTLQSQKEDLERLSAMEEQQRQISQALEQRTAELEQLQAERLLADEQLEKAKELNAQLRKDLSFYEETNKKFDGARQDLQNRLQAKLSAAREHETRLHQENAERQRLTQNLEEAQRELQNQSRRREALEKELQAAQQSVQEHEARLQKEAAERQRLAEELESAQRNIGDSSDRDLEISKLQSSLQAEQVERQRQETELARLRHSALDSAHAARALRTSLRRQVREPVDNVINSARSLLELEMGEEQKKLAESVLQDVLLVQTRLREPDSGHGGSPDTSAFPKPPNP
jgi:DNA-binding response OmpR family regulator